MSRTHFPSAAKAGGYTLALLALFLAPPVYAEVSFERDIRPILSANCFACHGPDEESRKGKLRLDLRERAFGDLGGHAAIVPGDAEKSALIARITHPNADERMPPPKSGKELTPGQIQMLRDWVAQGAQWKTHWAFAAPSKPAVPNVANAARVRNPIDAFVLARLEREGMAPSVEADAPTLLRRLSLDITGLPPTLEEADYFASQDLEAAYSHAVERLFASPHYGERFARDWLDAAQYADSDGFEKDKPRQVWAWRDYVINAFNNNLPYDRFVREQIAGDMLPNATQDQIVATGFLRNSMQNEEGGIQPEQFRMEAMFNRMNVIGRAVLGLTTECAQCHSHKYDPLSHAEYYRLFAFINNSAEACMTVLTPGQKKKYDEIAAGVAAAEDAIKQAHPDWPAQIDAWAKQEAAEPKPEWKSLALTFDDTSSGGQKFIPVGDYSFLAQGYAPTRFGPKMSAPSPLPKLTALRLELLTDANLPRNGPGRSIYGACALSEFEVRIAKDDQEFETFDKWERLDIASAIADVNPPVTDLDPEFPDQGKRKATTGGIDLAIDKNGETAWTTDIGPGRSNVPRYAIFTLAKPLEIAQGMKLGIRLQQNHGGWNSDDNQNNNLGRFRLSVTNAETLPKHALPVEVLANLEGDREKLFGYWRTTVADFARDNERIERLWRDAPESDTQLVYHELEKPRETHLLKRGNYLQLGERLEPGVPEFLNPMPKDAPRNRLGLALWMTDRSAPTTARAFVNRVWQHYFGTGIVGTSSDLGSQGDSPSNPELLDWLAVEFMESGWDVKALQRLIVNSATYRQSSQVAPAAFEKDPANYYLARGARFRVDGEIVRDIALAASGLLNPEVGGPSVHPPAPSFLFVPPASYGPKLWVEEKGRDRYRRGLYTFRFRSVPYPALQAFDAPPGDLPCTRRSRSNTPLQALTTLNEPTFVACAKALAAQTLRDGGDSDKSRVTYAFRRCNARAPEDKEVNTLLRFLEKQRKRIAEGGIAPKTILGDGADIPPSAAGENELAAWTLAARVLFNLDETITRE